MINIKEMSREFNEVEQYLMTIAPSIVSMKDVEDGATLAKEILTFLTGISTRDGEKFPVLIRAIGKVKDSEHRGLLNVIAELRKEETVIAKGIVERIGLNDSIFTIKYGEDQKFEVIIDIPDHDIAVKMLLDQLIDLKILSKSSLDTGV